MDNNQSPQTKDTSTVCKNCSNHFSGKYCNQCGEKVYKETDRKVIQAFITDDCSLCSIDTLGIIFLQKKIFL